MAWFMSYQGSFPSGRYDAGPPSVSAGHCLTWDVHPILKVEQWNSAMSNRVPRTCYVLLWYKELTDAESAMLKDAGHGPDGHSPIDRTIALSGTGEG